MIKQVILYGVLLAAISCGQHKQAPGPTTAGDSIVPVTEKKDSAIQPTATTKETVKHTVDLSQFIPENYTILDTTFGDLNLDQYTDITVVLKKNGEDTTSDIIEHPEKRPLLLLIGQPDNSFTLAGRNDNSVLCVDCGGVMGDPFMDVVIKKGFFSVEHYGGSNWRWTRTITYKYSPSDSSWYLHKDGRESFNTNQPAKVETTITTTKQFGKVPFDKFDIYKY
jgi:hypothetical protein